MGSKAGTIASMGKKLSGDKKDLHKYKGLLLRLPPVYRQKLGESAKRNRRSLTEEAKIAFELYFSDQGIWPSPPPAGKP